MVSNRLTLEYDEDNRAVWLTVEAPYGIQQKQAVWLHDDFSVDQVRRALLATGWVSQDGPAYRSSSDIRCEQLCAVIEGMLNLFDAPDVPSQQLEDVKATLIERAFIPTDSADVSDYSLAWLDVMVREDVADEARCSPDLWQDAEISVRVVDYCRRRVGELLARTETPQAARRMARSLATRPSDSSRAQKSG